MTVLLSMYCCKRKTSWMMQCQWYSFLLHHPKPKDDDNKVKTRPLHKERNQSMQQNNNKLDAIHQSAFALVVIASACKMTKRKIAQKRKRLCEETIWALECSIDTVRFVEYTTVRWNMWNYSIYISVLVSFCYHYHSEWPVFLRMTLKPSRINNTSTYTWLSLAMWKTGPLQYKNKDYFIFFFTNTNYYI